MNRIDITFLSASCVQANTANKSYTVELVDGMKNALWETAKNGLIFKARENGNTEGVAFRKDWNGEKDLYIENVTGWRVYNEVSAKQILTRLNEEEVFEVWNMLEKVLEEGKISIYV